MTASRVEAYLAALAKTAGREFDAGGEPILTAVERGVLAEADKADFIDAFRQHVRVTIELQRLDMLDAEVT